jgi:hypothetical protein
VNISQLKLRSEKFDYNKNNAIKAYIVDTAIPNSHALHSTITEKLQKYTDLKEESIRIWQMKTACMIPLKFSTTGIIPKKLQAI